MENNLCKQYMCKLRALDFSLYETALFLDGDPSNAEALAYYHKLLHQRKSLIADYEAKFGPLTIYGNASTDTWDWVKGPWPWEYDAN